MRNRQTMQHKRALAGVFFVAAVGFASPFVRAQATPDDPHAGHQMPESAPSTQPSQPKAGAAGKDDASSAPTGAMDHSSMQGGAPPPDARDPHAYSGGYQRGSGSYSLPVGEKLHMADQHRFGLFLADRFEQARTGDDSFAIYDVIGWYGRDYDRVWLRAEGEVDSGKLHEARTEVLWGHAVAAHWDTQLGLRYDSGEGPNRGWFAVGVQGLAPYWFEVEATGYIGDEGRTALRLEAEYELLITQRLVLQPRVEASFYGRSDPELGRGTGLSSVDAGMRLRYEIRREFAPYLGIDRVTRYGQTGDFARAAGADDQETRYVAGVRFWF